MRKVLIIEDEIEIGLLLSVAIKRKGFDVSVSDNLKRGHELFDIVHPDILILDIHFPDGNGIEHIRWFKHENSKLKIIMISAYDTLQDRQKAFEEGADEFLSKPFDLNKLNQLL